MDPSPPRRYAELVYNKAQRLTFDSSSPNGILLFRDASSVLCAYGSQIIRQPLPAGSDRYASLYKGVSICMLLLTRALSGNYVNFGVFALYGDRALADGLEVTINMVRAPRTRTHTHAHARTRTRTHAHARAQEPRPHARPPDPPRHSTGHTFFLLRLGKTQLDVLFVIVVYVR